MSNLPVIVGFGGISPAGRSSGHHGYHRVIFDKLSGSAQRDTLADIGILSNQLSYKNGHYVDAQGNIIDISNEQSQLLNRTLVRKIPDSLFNPNQVMMNRPAVISNDETGLVFQLRQRELPENIPANWSVKIIAPGQAQVSIQGDQKVIFPDTRALPVSGAGTLPTGFEPGKLYQSRNHPRSLQMAIYAASDALNSVGIDIDQLINSLAPDQIAVFASNSIGQLDDFGFGGLTKFPALGKRTTSKQMPLGYAQMPADFVNAYLLGNLGATGGALGACATFLYNLRNGVEAIRSNRAEFVLVGGADAPVTPEVIEGFRAMGALAEDKQLQVLDKLASLAEVDHRLACRPFGENCGFTIGESAQFIVLMSDRLAMQWGANIYASVPEVYVHADGYKKSISAPGVGNYLTLGKASALVTKILGDDALKKHSLVQAHGTSTPQNRVTESHVLNEIAKAFKIEQWPVSAIKAFLGHSQGTAGGDQLMSTLGIWSQGIVPGLTTTSAVADDVHQSNLFLPLSHLEQAPNQIKATLINSKGFGGNNASAAVISPEETLKLLKHRYSKDEFSNWLSKNEKVAEKCAEYDQASLRGEINPTYRYDYQVLHGDDLTIDRYGVKVPDRDLPVSFDVDNPYSELGIKSD